MGERRVAYRRVSWVLIAAEIVQPLTLLIARLCATPTVDCQSGPLPISTHCVMVVIGIGLRIRWCIQCSPRAWAFVGIDTL